MERQSSFGSESSAGSAFSGRSAGTRCVVTIRASRDDRMQAGNIHHTCYRSTKMHFKSTMEPCNSSMRCRQPFDAAAALSTFVVLLQGRGQGSWQGGGRGAAAEGAAHEGALWIPLHTGQREDQRQRQHGLPHNLHRLHPHLLLVPHARVSVGC